MDEGQKKDSGLTLSGMRICRLALLTALLAASLATASTASPNVLTFADRYDYLNCSSYIASVTVGDVNGDGIPDLVCAGSLGGLTTLFGNGDGTFRVGPNSTLSFSGSGSPTLYDLNGDGKLDVITTGVLGSSGPIGFVVSFGNGDGTFQPGTFYPTGHDKFASFIVTGDFNRDGILDFAALTESGVWLYTGKGGGAFNPGVLIPLTAADWTGSLAAIDLNEDGKLDIVAGVQNGFAVRLGNGDGTFGPEMDMVTPFRGGCFTTGDFNRDGHTDLFFATVQAYPYGLLYLGKGDGTFTLTRQVYLASYPVSVAAADVNGDGFLDIIASSSEIVFGDGKGHFSAPVHYPIASAGNGYYVLPADLRNNGRIDLVFSNFYPGISVLLNAGKGWYEDGRAVPISGGGAYCGVSGDFNRDGIPDLAVGVSTGLSILLGTGKASSPYTQGQSFSYSPYSCPVEGDLNHDGIPDVLVTTGDGFAVAFLGNGDGTFTQAASKTPVSANGALALGDFNGDGKLDFALTSNLLAYGNGDGTFQTPAPYIPHVMGNNMVGIAAARLHGGARSDIVLTDFIANIVYVLLNNGHGFTQTTFDPSTPGQCAGPMSPVLADLTGDGKKDLLIGCGGQYVPIYVNNGSGVFTYSTRLDYGTVADAAFPLVTDLNGDGILDVVVEGNSNLGVFTGEGSMIFSGPLYIGSGAAPGHVMAVDAHGQRTLSGRPDLLTPDATGVINVFFNTTK